MMLGGPKELSNKQVSDLLDLRETFKVPGKHPGKMCLNNTCVNKVACDLKSGASKKCDCSEKQAEEPKQNKSESKDMSALVAEITKRVLSELNK